MKLLCDVCENAVASLLCCADEAALCLSCDSRIHAANKLASKHQRMPLLPEASEPPVCDICQERPSFFFCMEDRALLCRECDVLIHSAGTLAAKHRRFLLTGIQVGVSSSSSASQETASAISLERYMLGTSSPNSMAAAVKKPFKQAATTTTMNRGHDNGGLCDLGEMNHRAAKKPCKQAVTTTTMNCSKDSEGACNMGIGSKEAFSVEKSNKASAPAAMNVKSLRSYIMNKQGTLSMPSNADSSDHRKAAVDNSSSNSTTISIQRISAGRVPFVAPVLSTLRAALKQEEASNNRNDHKNPNISNIKGNISTNINNSNNNVMMDVDGDNVSDYLTSGIPGWRLDELLTDLVGMCESGSSLSPPKESNALGFGIQEDPLWYAGLDFMEENEPSTSQEGVALVPEMPSPPTASGLVTSRGKPTCPAAQPWAYDYLFTDPHHSNEFSVVPDIDGHRSSPISTASPTRDGISKKRKFQLHV